MKLGKSESSNNKFFSETNKSLSSPEPTSESAATRPLGKTAKSESPVASRPPTCWLSGRWAVLDPALALKSWMNRTKTPRHCLPTSRSQTSTSCQISSPIRLERDITHLNHPEAIRPTFPVHGKICLPRNRSLVPKKVRDG